MRHYLQPIDDLYKYRFRFVVQLNIDPKESVFFDDRIINIEAAKEVGLNAYLFENYDEASELLNTLL